MDYINYYISLLNLENYNYYNIQEEYFCLIFFIFFFLNYCFIYYLWFILKFFFEDYKILNFLKNINYLIFFFKKVLNIYNFLKFFNQRINREAYYSAAEIFNNDLALYTKKKGSKGYVFYFWRLIKESYKSQIISLILSLFFRIIYFIFTYLFYYLFIIIMRFFYKNIFFFNIYYIILYIYVYIKIYIYKYTNINYVWNVWNFFDYIKSEMVLFFHQLELFVNWILLYIIDLIYHKNFNYENIKLINTGETLPFSVFIKNKMKILLPFMQQYKQKIYEINIYLNIFFLDIFFNILLIFFNVFIKLIKNINNNYNYFLLLLELNIFKYIFTLKNIFNLKFLLLFLLLLFNKYLFIFFFIFYLIFNNLYIINNINIFLNPFNNLINIFFWIIGFIFYYIIYINIYILIFFFKKLFLLIYKGKFLIFILFFFFTLGFDMTIIYLLIDTIWYYLGYMYILKFFSVFVYNDWFMLFWERFSIDNQIIWENTSQTIISIWLKWTHNSEFFFKDLCTDALETIKRLDTFEKFWTICGPISFFIYLYYDIKIFEIILSFFIWCFKLLHCYLYLNLTPFLFIDVKDYYFLYFYLWGFIKYILFLFKYIKIHFSYLYFYWFPYNFSIYYLSKFYFFYSIYFYYKYTYISYILNYIGFINLYFLINKFILNNINYIILINKVFYNYILDVNISVICIKFLQIIFFDIFYYIINLFNLWLNSFFSKIPKYFINIYFFINYWYEIQSNIDLISSYLRFSRYNFKKWILNLNYIGSVEDELFFSSMFSGVLENINLTFPLDSWFRNDHHLIIYNINLFIKYWKWQRWVDFQPSTNYMFMTRFNDFILRNFIYYYIYIYIIIYFLFKFIYNFYKIENYFFNSNYLWGLVKKSFNKKTFKNKIFNIEKDNIDKSKINEYIINKNKKIFFLKLKKNRDKIFFFLKKIKKNILLKLNNKYFFLKKKYLLKNIIKNIKKNKIFFYKNESLNLHFYKYQKLNYLYKNFIYSNYYSFFYNNFKNYGDIFNFFLVYLYKKNKYIKYIFMHENNVVAENIWNYPSSNDLDLSYKYFYKNSNNLLKNMINYFYMIDKNLFNYNCPNWLLHKNKSTFFFINTKKIENCSISVSYDFPFDVDFFFICIIPQTFLLHFFFFGQENEANIYEMNQQRQLVWLINIILSSINCDIFWYIFINYLSYWERFQPDEYIQNCISNGWEELAYRQVYTEKFFFIDLFWNYRSLYDLEYNYFSNNKYINISNNKLLIINYLQLFFFFILLIIYKLKVLNINYINIRKINYKIILLIYTNYKLKVLSLKNYLKKK